MRTRGIKAELQVRNNQGLTLEELKSACPAILQSEQHESRSNKYSYVSTAEVMLGLRAEGMIPTFAMQSRSRIAGKTEYTKHLLRFRRFDDIGSTANDIPEIVLINSHDGTSSYQMMSGIFRMVCSNGLICGDIDQNIRIPHVGKNVLDNVITASYTIIDDSISNMEKIGEMKTVSLTQPEKLLLAEYGMKARYGEEDELLNGYPHEPEKLLNPKRWADRKDDLYTTMNVIQENLIKGGVGAWDANNRRTTSREIKSIDNSVKVNKLLWSFSEELLKMKRGT